MNSELHVIFGTGPLGQSVMRALLARGRQVRMVSRSGRAELPPGVELRTADVYDPQQARAAAAGAAVVYQCAQPGYTEWPALFPPLQTSILNAAAAAGAKLIVGDNLYMYGDVDGPIHEDLPCAALTRKGQVRARMAQEVLDAHREGRVLAAIARGSDFYGPGVLGSALGERVFIPILKGKTASAVGNIDLPHTYTFIDDFGEAMAVLGEQEVALGQAWHVPSPPTLTTRQLIEMIFAQVGRPPRISSMGRMMLRIGGLFIPEARESIEMMYAFEKPYIVDDSKYVQAFGSHATPHEEAIRCTLAWYREHLAAHDTQRGGVRV